MVAEHKKGLRCAIYTRKSSEEGLDQSFNSLDAQREACAAYISSQRHEGWKLIDTLYDDGGYSGGNMERPALTRLLEDIGTSRIDLVVVYKVDRLTRSLGDFAKIVEKLDSRGVSFVSVTQQFNTTSSMGRLTLNVLLSFAQFEREVTGERIRDKIAASKRKGMWMGGTVPLGYNLKDRKLLPNTTESRLVQRIFARYLELGCTVKLKAEFDAHGIKSKVRSRKNGHVAGGTPYSRGALRHILRNPIYRGLVPHKGQSYKGEHDAIVDTEVWETVQARLSENHHAHRNGLKAKSPSLLAGFLYDGQGNRLTPSHTSRQRKRYRYYVSLIQGEPGRRRIAVRIPAQDIESNIGGRICAFLGSAQEVRRALHQSGDVATEQMMISAAKTWSTRWAKATPVAVRKFLLAIVSRIIIEHGTTRILLRKSALRSALLNPNASVVQLPADLQSVPDEDILELSVAASVRDYGRKTRLVIAPHAPVGSRIQHNPALIKAIARAHAWYEEVRSGKAQTEIAAENCVNETYVNYIIRLAFAAPDIIEAILEGKQPVDLTLEKMIKTFSLSWDEQRRSLGFS
jgi:site-specific DNA recombinase